MADTRPQPTALKVLRGNPGKRRLNHVEPQHLPLTSDCPAELIDPMAQAEWARIAPHLIACGQVLIVDRATLIAYCEKYAQWQALEAEARLHPFIVRSPNGYPLPNPALCMANKALKLMLTAAAETWHHAQFTLTGERHRAAGAVTETVGRRAAMSRSQAPRAIKAINLLKHTKGPFAGERFNLRPWQVRIVRQLFTTRKDGRRQYRTVLLMLPRKNGKTELAAALAVYFLLCDGEQGAEVYSAAADRDQASLVFNAAAAMIRNEPELLAVCELVESQKRIVHRASGSFYRAISAEAY